MTLAQITDLFEALTIFCFGLSWPISIHKSWVSRTAKGKSLFFEVFLLIGYAFGIARKIIQFSTWNYAVHPDGPDFIFLLSAVFYIINFFAISIDIFLFFRNSALDRARDAARESGR